MDVITIIVLVLGMVVLLEYLVIKNTKPIREEDIKALKGKVKDLQKSVDQIYDDYQDIGKMYFDLNEKVDIIIAMCEEECKEINANKLANEILKVLDVHETPIKPKFGTAKNLERIIF